MEMRAARYHGPGKPLSLESVAVRPPAHGEALVRVKAAGICHTDLHFLSGVLNLGISPLTLGHEIAGEVAELGDGSAGVAVGWSSKSLFGQGVPAADGITFFIISDTHMLAESTAPAQKLALPGPKYTENW